MGALFGLAAAGEEGAAVWTVDGGCGLLHPPLRSLKRPKPLLSFRSQILLGPGFAEGGGPCNVWHRVQGFLSEPGSLWGSGDSGYFSPDAPPSLLRSSR